MKYSIKPLLKFVFFTSIFGFLSSCSTYVHLGTTLYWSGKDVNEFMESKGLYPDDIKQCSSEKETFLIYGFARPLYNVLEYEVGRGHHAYGTTIYTKKEKVFTGNHKWTYVFTDMNGKIKSHRAETGFGDIDKEFKCNGYYDTSKLELKPRTWSAVAVRQGNKKQGIWGNDVPDSNLANVKKEAISQCEKESGERCEFLFGFSNACLSVAHAEKNGPTSYFGLGILGQRSKDDALANCKEDGASNCQVSNIYPVCSTPCDYEQDKQCFFDKPQLAKPGKNGQDDIFNAGEKNLF